MSHLWSKPSYEIFHLMLSKNQRFISYSFLWTQSTSTSLVSFVHSRPGPAAGPLSAILFLLKYIWPLHSFICKHLLQCHCGGLVPWDADSDDVWHAVRTIGSALGINMYGMVGKKAGIGREKLSHGTDLTTASTCSTMSSRAKMACPSCPLSGQRDQPLCPPLWSELSGQGGFLQPRRSLKGLSAFLQFLPWRSIWISHSHLLNKSYPLLLLANVVPPSTLLNLPFLSLFFHSTNPNRTEHIIYSLPFCL